jgi:hypothetical protein
MPDDVGTLVCPECFGNAGLKLRIAKIRPNFNVGNCHFHPTRKGVPLNAVASIVDEVARENFGGGIPDSRDAFSHGLELDELIDHLASPTDDDIASALKDELVKQDDYWPPDGEEAFYDEEYTYHRIEVGTENYGRFWDEFQKLMMHEQRFFSRKAFELLSLIFKDVEQQSDKRRRSPVYMIEPGGEQHAFYRARIVRAPSDTKKFREDIAKELGPPPDRLRTPGRLNPSGISAFYGAFDLDTCVAELRPSVGTRVALAKFQIKKPICVLDTTRFSGKPKAANMYKPGALQQAAQWNFMRSFMEQISKPVKRDDEHLDYIPTQAVAEYLAYHHEVRVEGEARKIDAIIYASAQNNGEGKNIAIFGAASVAGEIDKNGKRVKKKTEGDLFDLFPSFWLPSPEIRITPVPKSFVVHEVSAVKFSSDAHYSTFDSLDEG